jgi:GTP-binding protein EngB required for normal cell division
MSEVTPAQYAIMIAMVAEGLILIKWMLNKQEKVEKVNNDAFALRDRLIKELEDKHNDERVHVAESYVKKEEIKKLETKIENLETRLWDKMDQIQMALSSKS